jgi:2-methylcitrate dehydratase PrpD
MSDETLCERLAAYAIGLRFESIPREAINKAQDVILHNLAVAFGGVGTDQFNKAVDFAAARSGSATIIGQSRRASFRPHSQSPSRMAIPDATCSQPSSWVTT